MDDNESEEMDGNECEEMDDNGYEDSDSDEEECMEANGDSVDAPSSNEFGEEDSVALVQPKYLRSCSHQIQLLTF